MMNLFTNHICKPYLKKGNSMNGFFQIVFVGVKSVLGSYKYVQEPKQTCLTIQKGIISGIPKTCLSSGKQLFGDPKKMPDRKLNMK